MRVGIGCRRGRIWLLVVWLGVFLGVTLGLTPVYAWNPGTHAYVAEVLGLGPGWGNYQEIYGALVYDVFNFSFDPYGFYLSNLLHSPAAVKLWQSAQSFGSPALPLAFGFLSHNDVWGADATAHHDGRTYGQGVGYVMAKAADIYTLFPLPSQYGVGEEIQLLMNHLVVENAVDILLAQRLQQQTGLNLGSLVTEAALVRSPLIADLLVAAYAPDLVQASGGALSPAAAEAYIRAAEGQFQLIMVAYGQALAAAEPVPQLAAFLAQVAKNYPGVPPLSDDELTALLTQYIFAALNLCGNPDLPGYYWPEVAATVDYVRANLQASGISPVPVPAAWSLLGLGCLVLGLGRRFWG